MLEQVLWVEKYRPKTIEDCILPKNLKTPFEQILKDGEIPNLLLSGVSGVGKTTVARALLEQLGTDYIVINGSMRGNIDTLRNEISQFASTMSFTGGRKMVILDEADYLNSHSTQPALRNFMEEYSTNCGFILTCNFKNRIIEPLQGRCSTIDFVLPRDKAEVLVLQREALKRIMGILDAENVEYDSKVVATLLKKLFPDLRKVINQLQFYAKIGRIDTGVLVQQTTAVTDLVGYMKEKDFRAMRQWVAENSDLDFATLVKDLDKALSEVIAKEKIPYLVLDLNKYDYQAAFVANKEINTAAMLTEIMADCF